MKYKTKEIRDFPCLQRLGGCGNIICRTDGEFLIINGFKINEEYATQQITCTCGKKNTWKCEPEYLDRKKRKPSRNNRN